MNLNRIKQLAQMYWREYFRSMATSFVSAFSIAMVLQLDKLTAESFENGVAAGIIGMVVRTAIRAALQTLNTKLQAKK